MTTETINLDIGGMTCQACANRIEKVLNKKPAILEATVNYANETAHVSFDDSQTNADEVLDWVKKTGYTAHIQQADGKELRHLLEMHVQATNSVYGKDILSAFKMWLPMFKTVISDEYLDHMNRKRV